MISPDVYTTLFVCVLVLGAWFVGKISGEHEILWRLHAGEYDDLLADKGEGEASQPEGE